jgi:AI-2 transport protein TqsA
MQRRRKTLDLSLAVIALVLGIAALRTTAGVVQPVIFAYFAALLFKPILDRIARRTSRWFAVGSVVGLVVGLFALVVWFVAVSIRTVTARSEFYVESLETAYARIEALASGYSVHMSPEPVSLERLVDFATNGLQYAFGGAAHITIFLFLFTFFLMEFEQFHRKLVFGTPLGMHAGLLRSYEDLTTKFRRFMAAQTLISLITGLSTTVFLWMLGVDFALLWGALAFLLNFIPNIGSIIAVIPPVLVSWLQFDGDPFVTLTVFFGLGAIQNLLGNYFAPRMLGRSVALSPLVVFIAMIFWGWLWGLMGFLLSVPLTVAVRIVCENSESLRPFAVLLGDADELPHLEVLDPVPPGPTSAPPPAVESPSLPSDVT